MEPFTPPVSLLNALDWKWDVSGARRECQCIPDVHDNMKYVDLSLEVNISPFTYIVGPVEVGGSQKIEGEEALTATLRDIAAKHAEPTFGTD